jgi:hypothetical protein
MDPSQNRPQMPAPEGPAFRETSPEEARAVTLQLLGMFGGELNEINKRVVGDGTAIVRKLDPKKILDSIPNTPVAPPPLRTPSIPPPVFVTEPLTVKAASTPPIAVKPEEKKYNTDQMEFDFDKCH